MISAAYEQQLTEELQKAANDIHYGNAHAGIHVTIHRVQEISDRLIRQYEEVAPPLLRAHSSGTGDFRPADPAV